jgi:hypothetical protein
MRPTIVAAFALALAGCAKSSVIPLAADVVQIQSSAAPMCGATGAQKVAAREAAAETIRRGFDRFVIVDGAYANDVRVVGHTLLVANTNVNVVHTGYGGYGTAQTTYTGGQPIVGGSHRQGLTVKMFRVGDPAGANAIDARGELGPKWKDEIAKTTMTC